MKLVEYLSTGISPKGDPSIIGSRRKTSRNNGCLFTDIFFMSEQS